MKCSDASRFAGFTPSTVPISSNMRFLFRLLLLTLLFMPPATVSAAPGAGDDVIQVFARAHAGAPVRAVALGGSITQAGGGWIGSWLRSQFPRSVTTLANAGMSATGSGLAVFRLERDVLSAQPNLVFIETSVNDESGSDEEIIHSVESLVVRLKSQNPPSAIVILHAANANGLNKRRHSAVAWHYGLLEIDLDAALRVHLQREKLTWPDLMSDAVHPNSAGNQFYADAIAASLAPFVTAARGAKVTKVSGRLPAPISRLPLWTDGRMFPLRHVVESSNGWNGQSTLIDTRTGAAPWWGQFFNGVLSADAPGARLEIPFCGTAVGLLYALQPGFGSFFASVDGGFPRQIATGTREGYESAILARDLTPGEHRLTIVLPPTSDGKSAPVKLGALLVAGANQIKGQALPVAAGQYSASVLRALKFVPLPPAKWRIAGPFGSGEAPAGGGFSSDFETRFAPEMNVSEVEWKAVPEVSVRGDIIDFKRSDQKPRGVFYATTVINSERGGSALLQMTLDYYARVWLNGREIITVRDTHGHPRAPLLFRVTLKMGKNELLTKLHPGSGGANFSLAVAGLPLQ